MAVRGGNQMKAVREEDIRLRAYAIWQERGCPVGCDQDHWLLAEQQLLDAAPEMPVARSAPRSRLADAAESAETSIPPDADVRAVLPDDWAETRLEAAQFR